MSFSGMNSFTHAHSFQTPDFYMHSFVMC